MIADIALDLVGMGLNVVNLIAQLIELTADLRSFDITLQGVLDDIQTLVNLHVVLYKPLHWRPGTEQAKKWKTLHHKKILFLLSNIYLNLIFYTRATHLSSKNPANFTERSLIEY